MIEDLEIPIKISNDLRKYRINTERYLNNIIDMCRYKRYYFGHFHDNRNIPPYRATMLFHDVIELGDKICM